MNFIAVVILCALVCEFLLHFLADLLNLRHLRPELPEGFRDVYDPKRYAESQNYLRVNTKFGWVDSGFNLAVFLAFWFAGGFNALDRLARGWSHGPVVAGLIFIGLLLLFKSIIQLPFSIYETFVIEEKFGFNKTTWKIFAVDHLKGAGLAVVLGAPLLAGLIAFFQYCGGNAWWYCWGAVVLFSLVMRFIAPTWIMPLFNKFSPLEDGELKAALLALSRRVGFPVAQVLLMDGSRRSTKSNAFFTGFGRNRRIVLFDTLVKQASIPELAAVLGHEMGHYKLRHVWTDTLIGVLHTGVLFFLLSLFISRPALFNAFYMDATSVYAGMVFFGLLYSPVELFLGILMQLHSRRNEFKADRFSVRHTGDPKAMAEALKKLSVQNLSNLTPHPFYVFLNYSHPPMPKRVEAILGNSANSA